MRKSYTPIFLSESVVCKIKNSTFQKVMLPLFKGKGAKANNKDNYRSNQARFIVPELVSNLYLEIKCDGVSHFFIRPAQSSWGLLVAKSYKRFVRNPSL